MYPEALVEINPKDALKAQIGDGALMKVASRRGEIMAKAQVTDRVEPGLIFTTFHFPQAAANFLTNPALDLQAKIPEYKIAHVGGDILRPGLRGAGGTGAGWADYLDNIRLAPLTFQSLSFSTPLNPPC